MYKLYSMQRSGNSYKVRLALALLNAPYQAIEVDILRGESRTPDFLAKNPSGQVPLLEVADGRYLAESNAILWYVCGGTSLAPESRVERAEALQWMFFEQHALEPNIGAAYFWLSLVKGGRDLQTHALEDWMERGYAALQVMENHLKTCSLFRRRAAHGRRHRAVRLHPCRRPLRLRSGDLPRDPRLAAAGRADPRLRHHGLAAGPRSTTRPASPPAHSRHPARGGLLTFARACRQRLTIAGIALTIAAVPPFSAAWPPQCCRRSLQGFPDVRKSRVIRPALQGFRPMIRSPGAVGFESSRAPVASSRLLGAIATSLAIGTLSLCLMVTLTVLSIKATIAMPIP